MTWIPQSLNLKSLDKKRNEISKSALGIKTAREGSWHDIVLTTVMKFEAVARLQHVLVPRYNR